MSQNIKSYKEQVEKQLRTLGASTSLATTLVTTHGEFIAGALDRGRPADRLAQVIFNNHKQLQARPHANG